VSNRQLFWSYQFIEPKTRDASASDGNLWATREFSSQFRLYKGTEAAVQDDAPSPSSSKNDATPSSNRRASMSRPGKSVMRKGGPNMVMSADRAAVIRYMDSGISVEEAAGEICEKLSDHFGSDFSSWMPFVVAEKGEASSVNDFMEIANVALAREDLTRMALCINIAIGKMISMARDDEERLYRESNFSSLSPKQLGPGHFMQFQVSTDAG